MDLLAIYREEIHSIKLITRSKLVLSPDMVCYYLSCFSFDEAWGRLAR